MARKKTPTPKFRLDPAHRKVLRNSAKQIANERAAAETARRTRIREELDRAAVRVVDDEQAEQAGKVVRGLRSILTLVANSYPEWDPSVQVNVSTRTSWGRAVRSVSAWTDFSQVVVNYPASRFDLNPDGSPTAAARDSVREVLGLGYHEIGHNLYTVPFARLGLDASRQRAWNALEDQRMELAVVNASPDLAAYLTIVVLRNIVDSVGGDPAAAWLLVAGRLYLPKSLRLECRSAFAARHGDDVADRVRAIVREYAEADSVEALAAAVEKFYALLDEIKTDVPDDQVGGTHEKFDGDGDEGGETVVRPVLSDDWDEESDEDTAPGGPSDEQDDADEGESSDGPGTLPGEGEDAPADADEGGSDDTGAESDRQSDDQLSEGDDKGTGGGTSGSGSPVEKSASESFRDAVKDAIDDAVQDTDNGRRIDDALREINSASTGGSNLPGAQVRGVLTSEEQAAAGALASDFERALEEAAAYNSPTWSRHQEQGVVDPLAYRTRRPGDTSFRRQRVGDVGRGLDVAVSILLDVSGSMEGQERDLSVAALGVKTACWNLGLPCTVLTYDDGADLLWSSVDAPSPVVVGIGGCTNVSGALRDTHGHRGESDQHLVLILTDGHFSDTVEAAAEVDALRLTGTYVLGVALNTWTDGLDSIGCNASYRITEPGELARRVEDYLAGAVSGAA